MKKLEDMTEPEHSELMTTCAKAIEYAARSLDVEKPFFALVLFNDQKVGQYISNCTRASMIEALRETADRLEKRQTVQRVKFPKP
jgi:hypothetical protein